ncbi:MAG: hypothetical protein E6X52_09005 [Actinomyces sp.]|nr:hypothetical protein [Actinomyces sp.]MDU7081997.1 hypothetical protein [Clostridioides difficile]
MKKIKYTALLGLVIICIGGHYIISNGFDENNIDLILDQESIFQASEKEDVLLAYNSQNTRNARSLLNESEYDSYSEIGDPYKTYIISGDLEESMCEEKAINLLVEDNYQWEAPLYDSNGNIVNSAIVWNDNGTWSIGKIGLDIPENLVQFISDSDSIHNFIKKSEIQNPIEIKRLKFVSKNIDAVYILDESGEEYLIPLAFDSVLNRFNIENLKLYNAKELLKKLN